MAEVKLKFTSDTGQAIGGINQLKGSLNGLKAVAAGVSGAIAGIGIMNGITSLASAIKDSIGGASKAAASYETMGKQLEVLTGSAESASSLLKELTAFGAETPLETTDLIQATKTLLNFGVAVKDVMPNLRMLGDVSGGNAEKLQSLVLAFGKISSTGKATMENINMMIDAGFNPLETMAKNTGLSMTELYKRVSNGQVSVKDITEALKTATSSGGKFYQMLKEISGTTEGKLSNFADNITRLKVAFGTGFNAGLGKLLDGLNEAMPKLEPALKKLGEHAGKILENLEPAITKFVDELPKALESGNIWSTVTANLIKVFKSPEVKDAVSDLAATFIPGGQESIDATKMAAAAVGLHVVGKSLATAGTVLEGMTIGGGATALGSETITAATAGPAALAILITAIAGFLGGKKIGDYIAGLPMMNPDYSTGPTGYERQANRRYGQTPYMLARPEHPYTGVGDIPEFLRKPASDFFERDRARMEKDRAMFENLVPSGLTPTIETFKPEMLLRTFTDRTKKIGEFNNNEGKQGFIPNLTSLGKIGGAAGEVTGRAVIAFQQNTLKTQQEQLTTQKSINQLIIDMKDKFFKGGAGAVFQ